MMTEKEVCLWVFNTNIFFPEYFQSTVGGIYEYRTHRQHWQTVCCFDHGLRWFTEICQFILKTLWFFFEYSQMIPPESIYIQNIPWTSEWNLCPSALLIHDCSLWPFRDHPISLFAWSSSHKLPQTEKPGSTSPVIQRKMPELCWPLTRHTH